MGRKRSKDRILCTQMAIQHLSCCWRGPEEQSRVPIDRQAQRDLSSKRRPSETDNEDSATFDTADAAASSHALVCTISLQYWLVLAVPVGAGDDDGDGWLGFPPRKPPARTRETGISQTKVGTRGRVGGGSDGISGLRH